MSSPARNSQVGTPSRSQGRGRNGGVVQGSSPIKYLASNAGSDTQLSSQSQQLNTENEENTHPNVFSQSTRTAATVKPSTNAGTGGQRSQPMSSIPRRSEITSPFQYVSSTPNVQESQRHNIPDSQFSQLSGVSASTVQSRQRNDLDRSPAFDRLVNSQLDEPQAGEQDPMAARTLIWATTVDPNESIVKFKQFLGGFTMSHRLQFEAERTGQEFDPSALREDDRLPYYPRVLRQRLEDGVHILNLDCTNMKAYPQSRALYDQLIRYPQEIVIHVLDFVVTQYFCEMFNVDPQSVSFKCRPYGLVDSINLRDLNPEDIDKLISLKGFIIRVSNPIPELKMGVFKCNECDTTMTAYVENARITEPEKCSNANCESKDLQIVHSRCQFYDKQIIRIQETPDSVPDGQTPHTVSLVVYDELVDAAKPGDRVEVTGIYKAMPVRLNPRQRVTTSLFKTYVDVLHIKASEKKRIGDLTVGELQGDELRIEQQANDQIESANSRLQENIVQLSQCPNLYERMASSLAPSIYSRLDAKKAVLLQLFGGSSKTMTQSDSTKYRGNIHVLLCGDPATSKSQILQYVHRLAPRGIYTSGKGSSAVGLTAYVTRDPDTRQLVLESGALVLSDGGICCIDEFDKMSDSTRSVLHEAMEQQTVSVAKAGIITTLNARTSILAAANPIFSRWHQKLSVAQNLNLPPTLLSRFDIIYLMLDRPDENEDTLLARHISSLYLSDEYREVNQDIVDMELFAAYISYAREHIHPQMDDQCIDMIAKAYVEFRQLGTMSATTRQLEAIIRLSEAHAKMRLSQFVEQRDVLEAIRLIKAALQTAAIDPITGLLDMDLVTLGKSTRERNAGHEMTQKLAEIIADVTKSKKLKAGDSVTKSDLVKLLKDSTGSLSIDEDLFNASLNDIVNERPDLMLKGQLLQLMR
ncbi:hypothetical protein MP228_005550 [Amoeboaphelidium protococcarum]|nr:hypothetical protein MP228_005550 [Amoeboaphelidium protococcarum]